MTSPRYCVYTVMIGDYERLNEQPTAADGDFDFICLTDQTGCQNKSWKCVQVSRLFELDYVRSQRVLKCDPRPWLADYDASLYIDNSIILKEHPRRILERYLDSETDLVLPRHSHRETVLDEFAEVLRLGWEDPGRLFEQLNHLELECPEVLSQRPFWAGFMIRRHDSEPLWKMMEFWKLHLIRYGRRDQLSLNYALHRNPVRLKTIELDHYQSWCHQWPVALDRDRDAGGRNPLTAQFPPRLRIERAEKEASQLRLWGHGLHQELALKSKQEEQLKRAYDEASRDNAQLLNTRAESEELKRKLRELQDQARDVERLRALQESRAWRVAIYFKDLLNRFPRLQAAAKAAFDRAFPR